MTHDGSWPAGFRPASHAKPDGRTVPVRVGDPTRLSDLRSWHEVEASCTNCRHVARLRPKQLGALVARRLPRPAATALPLAELARRFACSECGNRSGNTVKVVTLDRNV